MQFSFIILFICFYIISQTSIDARTTGVSKNDLSLPSIGDYQGDSLHENAERKRQAGWGKRRDLTFDYDDEDYPPYYYRYGLHRHSARNWFDDE